MVTNFSWLANPLTFCDLDTETYEPDGRGVNNNIHPPSNSQHKEAGIFHLCKEYMKVHKQRALDCINSMAFLLPASCPWDRVEKGHFFSWSLLTSAVEASDVFSWPTSSSIWAYHCIFACHFNDSIVPAITLNHFSPLLPLYLKTRKSSTLSGLGQYKHFSTANELSKCVRRYFTS